MRRWRGQLARWGRLELEELTEIAELTDTQLTRVERSGIPTETVRRHRPLLRFYASLSQTERGMLVETGIQFRELEDRQAERLGAWRPSGAGGADARLYLRREPDAVVFRLDADASRPYEERIRLGRRGWLLWI